ncbi:MAG: hypothetical protein DRR06_20830 [Gammaproteobacteria bacterium]|nr:MAG: hypothetical protein DRR06_20830 [Gammaproteobacteria bacterium]
MTDSAYEVTRDIEGMFIQEMIPGGTEIAMGIFNDANYGKMLMLGLGGIFVEVIKDVVFWPATINTEEALYLIEQLKFKKIVEGIRGNIPVHKPWLAEVISKLGALAIHFDEIEEMDINPLSVNHDGQDSFILDGRIRIKS